MTAFRVRLLLMRWIGLGAVGLAFGLFLAVFQPHLGGWQLWAEGALASRCYTPLRRWLDDQAKRITDIYGPAPRG